MSDSPTDEPFPFEMPEVSEPDRRKALASNKSMWVTLRQQEVEQARLAGKLGVIVEQEIPAVTLTLDEARQAVLALCAVNSGIMLRKFGVIVDE